jgi:hypothetical protein
MGDGLGAGGDGEASHAVQDFASGQALGGRITWGGILDLRRR